MIYKDREVEKNSIMHTAERMCAAARTAPKACGVDNLVCAVVTDPEKEKLAAEMERLSVIDGIAFFKRDAENVRNSEAVVLIGTKIASRGINYCGFCGFENCEGRAKSGGSCAMDITDLGIAVGSAVSIAADDRVNNRVMFSIGKSAISLNLLGEDVKVAYGIPLSTRGKSIYFDRK